MEKLFKHRQMIKIICAMIFIIVTATIFFASRREDSINAIDISTKMAQSYDELKDYDMSVVDNNNNVIEDIKFGAYFVKDINGDGYNEKILGTCANTNGSDTLILDLNVSGDGYLKNGVISIGSENFSCKMTELKDDIVLENNFISNDAKSITLKSQIFSGCQRLFMGTIQPKLGTLEGETLSGYSKFNTISLSGIYVDQYGNETEISKSYDLKVDWYGTASARIGYVSNTTYDVHKGMNKEIRFSFRLEAQGNMSVKTQNAEVDIPSLKDEFPVSVSCDTGVYEYNQDTHILTISQEGGYTSQSYTITLVYPDTVYEKLIEDKEKEIVNKIYPGIRGYLTCYNNASPGFTNPYRTNTATAVATIQLNRIDTVTKISHTAQLGLEIEGKRYVEYIKGPVISTQKLLEKYDKDENLKYSVSWSVYRNLTNTDETTLIMTDKLDSIGNGFGGKYTKCVGTYFKDISLIPDDGIVSIYNNDTGAIIKQFTKEEMRTYTDANPYMYEEDIKSITVKTTNDMKRIASFSVCNLKEIDIKKMKEDGVPRGRLEDTSYLSTGMTFEGSKINNKSYADDSVYFVPIRSRAEISFKPNEILATDEMRNATIEIKVPKADGISCAEWKDGIFMVELPSKITEMTVNDIYGGTNIAGYELRKINGKYCLKIVINNYAPTSDFSITVSCSMHIDPMTATSKQDVNLYMKNNNCDMYWSSTSDTLDIDDDGNTVETVGKSDTVFNIVSASGLVTTERIVLYNDELEETVAPGIAEITKEKKEARINVEFLNNYSLKVSDVKMLGKIPFNGNTYASGQSLGSQYDTIMKDEGINVPWDLRNQTTVYYSTNANPTDDINLESNGWKQYGELDLSQAKTYLIVINGEIPRETVYKFSYEVQIEDGAKIEEVSYGCHTIYADVEINGAITTIPVHSQKVGLRVVKYYDLEINKYRENTTHVIPGAIYQLSELNDEGDVLNRRIITSNSEGKLCADKLRVKQIYAFTEILPTAEYEINTKVVKFRVVEDGDDLKYELLSEDTNNNFEGITSVEKVNDKYVLKSYVYDVPKFQMIVRKVEKDNTEVTIPEVVFAIGNKQYETKEDGTFTTDNLSLNTPYTISEVKAKDYYMMDDIEFEFVKGNDNSLDVTCEANNFSYTIDRNEDGDLIKLYVDIFNEKIPTYNLQILKVKENDNEDDITKLEPLEGATFILQHEDLNEEMEYTTGSDGIIEAQNLYKCVEENGVALKNITGNYTLKEKTAPKGYANDAEEIHFRVVKDGEESRAEILNEETPRTVKNIFIEGNTLKLVIQDKPLFTLKKVDSETGNPIANVEFRISEINKDGDIIGTAKDINNNEVGHINYKGEQIVKTDENGIIALALRAGKYEIAEIGFPEGYIENGEVERFEVVESKSVNNQEIHTDTNVATTYAENDVLIYTIDDLVELSESATYINNYSGRTIKLMNDLDFNNIEHYEDKDLMDRVTNTSGEGFSPISNFNGIFDGQGHKIENLYQKRKGIAGLFKEVEKGKIKDLYISGEIYIMDDGKGTYNSSNLCGGIVAKANAAEIINCHSSVDIYSNAADLCAGGIGGYTMGATSYTNCTNSGNITIEGSAKDKLDTTFIGGICGWGASRPMKDCENTGNINCKIIEKVAYTYSCVGGIIGYGNSEMENCNNLGSIKVEIVEDKSVVQSYGAVGGIAGDIGGKIINCHNDGQITCDGYVEGVGGILGGNEGSYEENTLGIIIENCYNTGKILHNKDTYQTGIGGIIGSFKRYNARTCDITNCYNVGEISAKDESVTAGGIAGQIIYAAGGTISNCYNTGKIDVVTSKCGGISGQSNVAISNCYNAGNINSDALGYEAAVGGIIGESSKTISKCYNTGAVISNARGECYVGGIKGKDGNIEDCYNTGIVSCVSSNDGYDCYVGGIAGSVESISNCYNIGNVRSSKQVNGVAGTANEVSNSYYLDGIKIIGEIDSDLAVSASTNEMKTKKFYDQLNVNEVWSYRGYTYPKLANMPIEIVESTEITVQNTPKTFRVKTKVNEVNGVKGGTISGDGMAVFESITYNGSNNNEIIIAPDSEQNYLISEITINNKAIPFDANEDGTYVIQANYFTNVKENKEVVVTFAKAESIITINKVDNDDENIALEGAKFRISEVDTRPALPEESLGEMNPCGEILEALSTGDKVEFDFGTLQNNGSYNFIQEGNTIKPDASLSGGSTTNGYYKIDLSGLTGKYVVTMNVTVTTNAPFFARITDNSSPIILDSSDKFIYISSAMNNTNNYESQILTARPEPYYLQLAHLYYLNPNIEQNIVINSIELHKVDITEYSYYFENQGDKYVSNNAGIPDKTANSRMLIDLEGKEGKYDFIVNAGISSQEDKDYGYVTISEQETTPAYTEENGRFVFISGECKSKEYKITLDGNKKYYAYFGYYKDGSTDSGEDKFKINDVRLELNPDHLVQKEVLTNNEGKATIALKAGSYVIREIEAPEGYEINKEIVSFDFDGTESKQFTIKNTKNRTVIVHYYEKETGEEHNCEPVKVQDDKVIKGALNEPYRTQVYTELNGYSLVKDGDEYKIPEDATGVFQTQSIDVYYYYEMPEHSYSIRYFYSGEENEALRENIPVDLTTIVKEADIEANIQKNKLEGYYVYDVRNIPLTVSENEEDNVIEVYYEKMGDPVETYKLNVTKVNANNKEQKVEGAEFEVYEVDGETEKKVGTLTHKGNGLYESEDINITKEGTINIKLKETKVPDGYKAIADITGTITVELKEDAEAYSYVVTKAEFEQVTNEEVTSTEDDKYDISFTIEEPEKGAPTGTYKLNVTKVNANNKEQKVEGAEFEVYEVDEETEKKVGTLAHKGNGLYETENINITKEGTINLKLKETKVPEGYKAIEDIAGTIIVELQEAEETYSYVVTESTLGEVTSTENEKYDINFTIEEPEKENPGDTPKGTITVVYTDNLTGKEIIQPTKTTGEVGTEYTIERKDIPGYKIDIENLPTNETGKYTAEGDTVTYKYIELKKYEIMVRYTAGEDKIDEAKIGVKYGYKIIDEYTKDGVLKIGELELTDLGTLIYTIYETETPQYCKTVVSKEKPAVVTLIRQLNKQKNKYEFVANYEEIDGFNVIIDDENRQVIFDITTEKKEKYNLAIKKFITAIDEEQIENRAPQVEIAEDGKITYKMNNEIEKASNKQKVTYTLRMYNESDVIAKGKSVIEYIPDGLVFVPENDVNKKYGWAMYKVDENGKLLRTEDVNEAIIVVTDYLVNKEINAFNKASNTTLDYLDVEVVFEVDESKITSDDRIIENKVLIMPNENDDYPENDESTEKLYVKYFDLSIEKYIDEVKVNTNGNEKVIKVGYDKKDELVKIDVKRSEVDKTKLTVTYGLLVKNVGEIAGYATEIKDYIPRDFKIINSENWKLEGNEAINTQLEDVVLEPGESTTVYITCEWKLSEESIGERYNEAEISKYKNDYDAIDVTGDNKDKEGLLVTLKTGAETVVYVEIAVAFVAIIVAGAYLVKKCTSKNKK